MFYENDSSRVWHVAKSGNDSNSGHAGQYPVNLANDAKLTIGAAVSAAADGDTIIIWPGDYAEAVNASSKSLRMIGVNREKTRIVPASGMGVQPGTGSYIANLSVITGGSIGISIAGKANVTVENCYANGTADGLYVTANTFNLRLIDCRFNSVWDGANMGGTLGVFVERCMFETTGSVNICHALQTPGSGVYRNCIFNAVTSSTGSSKHGAVELGSGYAVRAVFENCYFNTSAPVGRTGDVFGIYVNDASSAVVLNGCIFNTVGPGASGGPKDLYQGAGSIIVNGCSYSTYSGTITQGDSRWANAVKAQAGAAIDENTSLQKTIKMLINKAVQNKLSGEIRYFDDDGQTVILTHTPNEDGSGLTRMVS